MILQIPGALRHEIGLEASEIRYTRLTIGRETRDVESLRVY